MDNRIRKKSSQDSLFADTFKTDATIRHCLALYRGGPQLSLDSHELRFILTMGSALDGWAGVCHGGVICTILDEAMSFLVNLYCKATNPTSNELTAGLRVRFLKPVHTPGSFLIKTKVSSKERRKFRVSAELLNQKEVCLATADGLFIALAPKL